MKNKKKTIILVIGIVLMGLLVVGGTYAYLINVLNVTNGNYNVGSVCFDINYDTTNGDGTSDITGTLIPSATSMGGLSGKVSLSVVSSCDVYASGNLFLNVNNVDSTLVKTSNAHCENFKTLKTLTEYTNETSCEASKNGIWVTDGTALKYAVYSNVNNDPISVGYVKETGSINVYNNFNVSSIQKDYRIYIWLDGNLIDNTYESTKFNGDISAKVVQRLEPLPEKPTLDDGMIPVRISTTGVVKTISKEDDNWYDYSNKEWANVVLVDDDSRGTYRGTTGVTVSQDDILAYYVWIPSYSYKINGSEEPISISFDYNQSGYRSHSAFWWDSNNDGVQTSGEIVDGFWAGKFETTQGTSSNIGTDMPTILPNTSAWIRQNINMQFTNSLKFSGGTYNASTGVVTYFASSVYGLGSSTISHMMKNSEWGAIAYLSHSEYGFGSEICINNSSAGITGRSGGAVGGSVKSLATQFGDSSLSTTTQYNSYGYYTWLGQIVSSSGTTSEYAADLTLGTCASTTGNVTGIYDMSGGNWDYVMGIFANSDGTLSIGSSGFSNLSLLEKKFLDIYKATNGTTITSTTACNNGICFGHALSETANWHSDTASFVSTSSPWFTRGGGYGTGAGAGIFNSMTSNGSTGNRSWRSVLIIG